MKPLYDLLPYNSKFRWNIELETLFQQISTSNTKDVTLTLTNTNRPIFISVDFSLISKGCVLFQTNNKGKLDVIQYTYRFLTTKQETLLIIMNPWESYNY